MNNITLHGKLIAKEVDLMGYQSLVFLNLDTTTFGHRYCLLTVFPNWESRIPEINEVGYINYDEVEGGIDTYYDRETDSIVKYNYTNSIFKKFVKEIDNCKKDIII